MNEQFYQGDVLLIRKSDKMHREIKGYSRVDPDSGRLILARGEKTGHHHTVDAMTADLFSRVGKSEDRTLVVYQPTAVVHQEHPEVLLSPGEYEVRLQRQHITDERPMLSASFE